MLLRHSFIYVVSNLGSGVFGLATAMVMTRMLNPTSYGIYGLTLGVAVFLGNAVFDWHGTSFLRFAQNGGDRRDTMATFLALFSALTAVSALGLAAVYASRIAPDYDAIIAVGCVASVATGWFQFAARVQMADLRPSRTFWMNLTRGSVTLVLSIAAALLTESAIYVLLAAAAAQIAAARIYRLRGLSFARRRVDFRLMRSVLAFGWPIAVSMALGGVNVVVSRFMLDHLASTEAVGRFTAASFAVQNTLNMIAGGVGTASYPLAVRAIEAGDSAALQRELVHNFALLIGILLPGAVGLSLIAPNLAPLLVGREFVDAVVALTPWLAAAAVVGCIRGYHFDYAFQFGRKTGYLTLILSSVTVLNIGLNALLIPRYGERGAAMAQLFALAPSLALAVALGPRVFSMPWPLKAAGQVMFASLLMAAALLAIADMRGVAGLAVQLLVGAVVYAACLTAVDFIGMRGELSRRIRAAAALVAKRAEFGPAARAGGRHD